MIDTRKILKKFCPASEIYDRLKRRMNLDKSRLGDFIRQYRTKKDITQAELGSKLGYTGQFIANWERGVSSPPAETLKKMADVLDIPKATLVNFLTQESAAFWQSTINGRSKRRAG